MEAGVRGCMIMIKPIVIRCSSHQFMSDEVVKYCA